MAELKFLRGSYTGWTAFTKDPDSFYIVEEQDGRFSLYLGEKFLCNGVSKADLATAVTNLVNGATEGYDTLGDLETKVKALEAAVGEGGSVADKITAAIGDLDAEVTSADGTHVTVKVTEVDGVIAAVNVIESDIASAQALADEVTARTAADEALDVRLDVIEGEAEGSIKKAVADAKAAIEGTLEDSDAKTIKELNDRIDTVSGAAKSYSIATVEGDELSALGTNVKEAFKLVDEKGAKAGEYIQVYKDSALQSVVLDGQELVFTYLLDSGEESVVRADVSTFLAEAEFKNGLVVNADGEVSVKVDSASEGFLTVGEGGVKLSGVQDAINVERDRAVSAETANANAITAETAAREAADKAINDTIGTVDSGKTVVGMIADEATAREAADKAINDKIGEVAEGKTVVEMINAAKAAATTKVVEGTDGGNNLEVASATSEDGSVTYTINLTDVASATALTGEVTRATEAEDALQSQITAETAAREAAIDAINDKIGEVAEGKTVVSMIADETERVNQAISNEATARTAADEALDGRLDALEAVKVTGKDAIVVSASGATENKDVSLKLATQPAEGEAGVVLSQDTNGLKATLQWGTF